MKELERYFLDTVAGLEAKAAQPVRSGLIEASGALRRLLLEGLVDKVNRAYRLKLAFTFLALPKTGQEDAIVAIVRLPKGTTTGGLAAFLAAGCLALDGRVFTVREVILANANVKGGVHFDEPRDEGQLGVVALDHVMRVGNYEASVAVLHDIINVTLDGLRPLVEAIRNAEATADTTKSK